MAKRAKIDSITALQIGASSGAIIGLFLGISYAFGGLLIDSLTIGFNAGTVLAFGALVGMPLIFAIPGLIAGAIGAVLYNLAAKPTGK